MLLKLCIFAIIATLTKSVNCGHYSIVGSSIIRENTNYHVSVTAHDGTGPSAFLISVTNVNATYNVSAQVSVNPYSTATVTLPTGTMLPSDSFSLNAQGLNGLNVTNTTSLTLNTKSFSTFIQTDKAIYKPSDLIRFRIIDLDSNLKPLVAIGPVVVFITDSQNNRIQQWNNIVTIQGVFEASLLLSDLPNLGTWTISVVIEGQTISQTIQVAEYVLPKFSVSVNGPIGQVYSSGKLTAIITATYTYGQPVSGTLTVSVSPEYGNVLTQRVLAFNGTATVSFTSSDLQITSSSNTYDQDFNVTAIVQEGLTGLTQSSSGDVTLHVYPCQINAITTSTEFIPGLPFIFTFQITNWNGTPVIDTVNKVNVTVGPNYDETGRTWKLYSLDSNGEVTINFILPDPDGFYVDAIYLGQDANLGYFSANTNSQTGQYLLSTLQTANPTVGSNVQIQVQGTQAFSYLTYDVVGRGDVLISQTIQLNNQKTATINFQATFAMAPVAHFIVYYFSGNYIVSDEIDINFASNLTNLITLGTSLATNATATPGQSINLNIKTAPHAYVGLLGVDQSVILLQSGNDITLAEVFDDLDEYSSSYSPPYYFGPGPIIEPLANQRKKRQIIGPYYNPNPWTDFSIGGAVLLTNAIPPYTPIRRPLLLEEDFAAAPQAGLAAPAPEAPAAVQGPSTSVSSASAPVIRKNFPDTWIWTSIHDVGTSGAYSLNETLPDTITTWIITAFSIDPITGLGLTSAPTNITGFKPFFVSLDLPYSIKHGEIISIPVDVFNYLTTGVQAVVTLFNSLGQFEFAEGSNPNAVSYSKNVSVPANQGVATSFLISSLIVGSIIIKVTAVSNLAGDGLQLPLLVEPEGVTIYGSTAIFVDLRNTNEFSATLPFSIPSNAVVNSTEIQVSVIGDIMGLALQNLDDLIQLPTGCGEQTMLSFVPDLAIYNYLNASNTLTADLQAELIQDLNIGYQRELTFKHSDNSFSAFGNSDPSGSTWLTAFVCKSFQQASSIIQIDPTVIQNGLTWLAGVQAADGSFPEVGRIIHTDMQGEASGGIALTAYVLTSFLENQVLFPGQFTTAITNAINNIVGILPTLTEVYPLALVTYALTLAQNSHSVTAYNAFNALATVNGTFQFWIQPVPPQYSSPEDFYYQPNSVNVEITSYGLLIYLLNDDFVGGEPIMKWILSQQNAQGGFSSTQDTVIGIQALAQFASKITPVKNDLTIYLSSTNQPKITIYENAANAEILQIFEIAQSVREVDVYATGTGFALLTLSFQYNLNLAAISPAFQLTATIGKNSTSSALSVEVCSSFIQTQNITVSNMAVLEINLPSGYTSDPSSLPSVLSAQVAQFESLNSNTQVVLYFNSVNITTTCVSINAYQTYNVANLKPVLVSLSDYYDTTRTAQVFYNSTLVSLCDICGPTNVCPANCTTPVVPPPVTAVPIKNPVVAQPLPAPIKNPVAAQPLPAPIKNPVAAQPIAGPKPAILP